MLNVDWQHVRAKALEYERLARGPDDALYALCRNHPDHVSLADVEEKVLHVGRSAASAVARMGGYTDHAASAAAERVARFLHEKCGHVDEIIQSVPRAGEMLTEGALAPIIVAQAKLRQLLHGLAGDDESRRPFASLYLHFHMPKVPVFDGRVAACLAPQVPWVEALGVVPMNPVYDEPYYRFVMRFWAIYQGAEREGFGRLLSVRRLDYALKS